MSIGKIELRTLSEDSYDRFMVELQDRYAKDRMESNLLSEEEAIEFTQNQWSSFLPDGRTTEGHFFFDLINSSDNSSTGVSWLFINKGNRSSFIFELFLAPELRGMGLGKSALRVLEDFAKSQGARTLGLNVFASNDRAKSLYTGFGFRDVSTDMIKSI
jgi:GNAT superfamily N-acetyltransferase